MIRKNHWAELYLLMKARLLSECKEYFKLTSYKGSYLSHEIRALVPGWPGLFIIMGSWRFCHCGELISWQGYSICSYSKKIQNVLNWYLSFCISWAQALLVAEVVVLLGQDLMVTGFLLLDLTGIIGGAIIWMLMCENELHRTIKIPISSKSEHN